MWTPVYLETYEISHKSHELIKLKPSVHVGGSNLEQFACICGILMVDF